MAAAAVLAVAMPAVASADSTSYYKWLVQQKFSLALRRSAKHSGGFHFVSLTLKNDGMSSPDLGEYEWEAHVTLSFGHHHLMFVTTAYYDTGADGMPRGWSSLNAAYPAQVYYWATPSLVENANSLVENYGVGYGYGK
jgi:hypothetical protein